jgi:hypothetical protein
MCIGVDPPCSIRVRGAVVPSGKRILKAEDVLAKITYQRQTRIAASAAPGALCQAET